MTVTAKFKVSRLTPWSGEIIDGRFSDNVKGGEVEMTPDYADGKNKEWSDATPSGVLRLSITNTAALKRFEMNKAATITIDFDSE